MMINTYNMISISESNQNFSKVEAEQLADDEDIRSISKRLIEKNRKAYEELAK